MPTITELAAMAYLSLPRFKQKFKQVTGVPPAEYIIREKIALAESLLAENQKSITDIAMDLGFCSSQHFSVVFKKYTGESPQAYRSGGIKRPK
jgi:AraC-like DNA-binding protein